MQVANTSHENTSERIAEIGEILALGLVRLLARKSSEKTADREGFSLDCAGQQSGHGNPKLERIGR